MTKNIEIQNLLETLTTKELVNQILKEFDFGNALFAEEPSIARLQGKKREDNTNAEEKAYRDITDFIGDMPTRVDKARILKQIPFYKKIQSKVPSILKPDRGLVYRGSMISLSTIKKVFKNRRIFINSFTSVKIQGKECFKYKKPYVYKPKSNLTSWSYKMSVAMQFGETYENKYQIVYQTAVNDDFIFNDDFMNSIDNFALGNSKEYETLSFAKSHKCSLLIPSESFVEILNSFEENSSNKYW